MKRALGFLAGRRAPLAAALLAVALTLPALGVGLIGDDYMHRSILLGVGGVAAGSSPVTDLFVFVPDGPRRQATLDLGTMTWWAHPQVRVALFRPLESAEFRWLAWGESGAEEFRLPPVGARVEVPRVGVTRGGFRGAAE
jgi:hypothetical protein